MVLFLGDLNFSETSRIQTQVYIENENSEKVYWIDGINSPRYINILKENLDRLETSTTFNLKFYNTHGQSVFYKTLRTNVSLSMEIYLGF